MYTLTCMNGVHSLGLLPYHTLYICVCVCPAWLLHILRFVCNFVVVHYFIVLHLIALCEMHYKPALCTCFDALVLCSWCKNPAAEPIKKRSFVACCYVLELKIWYRARHSRFADEIRDPDRLPSPRFRFRPPLLARVSFPRPLRVLVSRRHFVSRAKSPRESCHGAFVP